MHRQRDVPEELADQLRSLDLEIQRLESLESKQKNGGKYKERIHRLRSSMDNLGEEIAKKRSIGSKKRYSKKREDDVRFTDNEEAGPLQKKLVERKAENARLRIQVKAAKEKTQSLLENDLAGFLHLLKDKTAEITRKKVKGRKSTAPQDKEKAAKIRDKKRKQKRSPISVSTSPEPEIGLWHTMNAVFGDGVDYDKLGLVRSQYLHPISFVIL